MASMVSASSTAGVRLPSLSSTAKCDKIVIPGFVGLTNDATEFKYRYSQYLSQGSSGCTWRVVRNQDEFNGLALKVIRLDCMEPNYRMRTEIELQCLQAVNHFACIRLLDMHRTDICLFLVMEYCDAGDLRFQLNQLQPQRHAHLTPSGGSKSNRHLFPPGTSARGRVPSIHQEGLEEYRIKFILLQLVLGLHYMHVHRKILHRDVKPANVLLTTTGLVKIGDFGLSNSYDTISGDIGQTICGTPLYTAPEMWTKKRYGKSADLWSLGVVMYECMAGRPPFSGANVESLQRSVISDDPAPIMGAYSPELVQIVFQLLHKNPSDRPDSRQLLATPYLKGALMEFPEVLRVSNNSEAVQQQVQRDIHAQLEAPNYVVDTTVYFEGDVERHRPPEQYIPRHLVLKDGTLSIERRKKQDNSSTAIGSSPVSTQSSACFRAPSPDSPASGQDARPPAEEPAPRPPAPPALPSSFTSSSCISVTEIDSVECLDGELLAIRIGDRNLLFFRTPEASQWKESLQRALGWIK